MSSALLTGMQQPDAHSVCAVCVNDILSDEDYRQLFGRSHLDEAILIPTIPLKRSFPGGYLELDADTQTVRRIIEKPHGGCPAGAAANIMIHQIFGRCLLTSLKSLLSDGIDYETAVNKLIESGTTVTAVPISWWVAIKTPGDIARCQAALAQ